jgi:O-Antigen ligase
MAFLSQASLNLPLVKDTPDLGRKFLRMTVIPLMLISILAPVIRLNDDFWLKPDELLLPVIAIVYVWLMLAGRARPISPNPMYVVALVFCAGIAMSLIYGAAVMGHPVLARDFFEFPKAVFPVLFFTLTYEADLPENSLRTMAAMLVPAILLICVYAYGQWFNLGFTYYLQPYYSGGLHDDGSLSHYRRVYSTLSNPNTLGILMTWVIAAFTLAALFRVARRFWMLAALVASLIALTMTGSRYGLIDTVFALIAIFLLPAPTAKSKMDRHIALFISLPLVLGVILVVAGTNRATLERFEMLRTPMEENSLRMRLDSAWLDAADQFLQSPVLGQGPAKDIFSGVVTDSEYLIILKQFGVVGLIPYLCFFLVPLAMTWKGIKNVPRAGPQLEQHWRATYWGLCLGFLVPVTCLAMNIGMGTYYDTSLVAFTWMWMGIAASCADRVSRLAQWPMAPQN